MNHLPKIILEIVPLSQIEVVNGGIKGEVADYRFDAEGTLQVKIAAMKNPDHEAEIFIHEFSEWYANQRAGITIEQVDQADRDVDSRGHYNIEQKIYSPHHQMALSLGRVFIEWLGGDFNAYQKKIESDTDYLELFEDK